MSGALTIMLGGVSYRLLPTFAALLALEEQSGLGLLTLAKRFAGGEFTLAELVALIRAGLIGAGEKVPDNLGALVLAQGLSALTPVLTRFLEAALNGDSSAGKA